MEPIIRFENYSFKYRAQIEPTLRDISLSVYPGEKVLIVGPSGSGKSTIAHCINGLVPLSFAGDITGSLTVAGQDPSRLGVFEMSKIVGTVLQDTDGQFIGLTVAEDIAFALENDCVGQAEMRRRVADVAGIVEVDQLLRHAPGELSGGQKQRVSVAGVMVDEVEILVFDEPLANLDPATGKKAIALIDRLAGEGNKTVLIIEHRLEDVLYREVDRIVVIGEGKIVADTTPAELLAGDVLAGQGIREPLYITALKHIGLPVAAADRPQSIETMNLAPYREQVREWFRQVPLPPVKPQRESVLAVEALSFSYQAVSQKERAAKRQKKNPPPGKMVLKQVGFAIRKGEMVSIVGKNGAGKSTLASLVCGFYHPTEGRILLAGEDIAGRSVKERGEQIGLVMQSPGQMISKPMIFDEVALGLAVRGVPAEEIKERVYEVLKICGLYPFRNWPVSALSYGQKKRVTIASILVLNPQVLILDEPTAGQDYRHYTEIMEFLREINLSLSMTIVMITHDMHLMLEYTDRAIVIADGQLVADDAPAAILTDERITERAYLKKTSLYDLAVKCDISDPTGFAARFIDYERKLKT